MTLIKGDLTSKAEVLETYADLYHEFEDNPYICKELHKVYDRINALPSAEADWIPCSERLPSEPFGCLVTVWDSTPTGEGDDFENILPYFVGWDGEQWNDEDGGKCPFEVIAWMPLPMPYREDGEA